MPQRGRRGLVSALTSTFLLFPLLVAPLQQEQEYYRKSPHESYLAHHKVATAGHHGDKHYHRTTPNSHHEHTTIKSPDASAIADHVAPADHNKAVVGAPPSQRESGKAGLYSPQIARSLQDWEVEDFVLLATVDGSIHARDRRTGAPRWKLEVDRPMVETTYHHRNKSGDETLSEYEFLWIVEPSRDGDIYIYNQARNGGLQRLHLTVKQLVEDMSPYESVDPAVVYNAEKKTKLYTVDARSGKITKVFGSAGESRKHQPRCPKPGGLESLDDEECGPGGSFVLGRTEYTIEIQNQRTTEAICTLMYSEWGPNNRDEDLHRQYSATLDSRYIYPLHDGSIFGWDYTKMADRQRSYVQKLSSPVVRVFDVARPMDTEEKEPQFVVLPQPSGPLKDEDLYSINDRNRIFVNHTDTGGWFAMSENTYPLVTGRAKQAQCYDEDWLQHILSSQPATLSQRQEGLIGVHSLSEFAARRDSGLKTISGPPSKGDNRTPPGLDEPYVALVPALGRSRFIPLVADIGVDLIIVMLLSVFFAFVAFNWRLFYKGLKETLTLKSKAQPSLVNQSITSVPSSPVSPNAPYNRDPVPAKIETTGIEPELEKAESPSQTPTLDDTLAGKRNRTDSVDEKRGRPDEAHGVRFADTTPPPSLADDLIAESPQAGKKKARRGCRGGAKHRKKRSNSKHEKDGSDEVEEIVQEVMQMPKDSVIEPTITKVESTTNMIDVSGPIIQVGRLRVFTDTVLGFGSHGTMVYKGSFDGRDVAVKRMLQEFYDIASHEVGLLQESDDHPNVIRYFDKESAGEFLYIALELCPASLQDVVEKPEFYTSLMNSQGFGPPDMLKQITLGVQYLHALKIVHRDIKPQNILVSNPKLAPLNPSVLQPPRLLISDFGLCKKLEGDQNSFRATTAHAAGTSGWRAPELLVDEDLIPGVSAHASQITEQTHSEPAVVDPSTNRRATRAIDIFSLGCVFYYVLTRGLHPFDKDGKYMREANIVKGFYNIDQLEILGDYQWEAKDLVSRMLSHNPKQRPDAGTILTHPFFWCDEDRLDFLRHVSDAFEFEPRDPPSPALETLESYAPTVLAEAGGDFLRALPKDFVATLGKQRKYNGGKILDLLRALRNKKNHYEDMPEGIKKRVGPLPGGYLGFWTREFPRLLLSCQGAIRELGWDRKMGRFKRFY